MARRWTASARWGALVAALGLILLAAAVLARPPAAGGWASDPGSLRTQIERSKGREAQLSSAAARLGVLERRAAAAVAVLERRLAAVQHDLDVWRLRLARTQARLRATRERLVRLRAKLAEGRRTLAAVLRSRYTTDAPDFVSVVLEARGFAQVLERLEFLHRIQRSDTRIVGVVQHARDAAVRTERELARLEPRQRSQTLAVERERNAVATMTGALRDRRDALARARSARLSALAATVAGRRRAQRELDRLLAAQARAAAAVGPGGPWAIPWPIVQCESGGQNLPPNWATASGYYQFIDDTWRRLGGSTPHAYQASKAEQDRLAARLWAGGGGAHNWDCYALVM
jgi:peptidoglycan hydrolase CwlO-like protein